MTNSASNSGGLIGLNTGTAIGCNINNVNVTGGNTTGGVVGYNSTGTIKEMTMYGSVTGLSSVGGAVGVAGTCPDTGCTMAYIYSTLVNATVKATSSHAGGLIGRCNSCTANGVVEGGTITATSGAAGKSLVLLDSTSTHTGVIYVSSAVTVSRTVTTNISDGLSYNKTYHPMGMYDGTLDTWYGGDNDSSGYYMDYENDTSNRVIVKSSNTIPTKVTFSGGQGTEDNPYILMTEQDFKNAALYPRADNYYKIGEDIDVSTFKHFYPLGTASNAFQGYLDGNNKTISNMQILGSSCTGLLGYMNGASVKNLNIINSKGSGVRGNWDNTGILAGMINNSTIENIKIENITVAGTKSTNNIDGTGGLVGYVAAGTIKNIAAKNVTASGTFRTGGLVGLNKGTIENIEATTITSSGANLTAGIVGQNTGTIQNVKVINPKVTGSWASGGVVGQNSSILTDVYLEMNTNTAIIDGGSNNNLGGIVGTNSATGTIKGVNVRNGKVKGGLVIGGIAGYNYGTIIGVNLFNINLTGTDRVGGIVAYNVGTIKEGTVRGTINATYNAGGAVGYNGEGTDTPYAKGYVYNVLVNTTIKGTKQIGGFVGMSGKTTYGYAYGIVEGVSVTSTGGSSGKANGWSTFTGSIYVSSAVTVSRTSYDTYNGSNDGTSYNSSNNNNLTYYSSLKYDTNKPMLETKTTGDVNGTGYIFDYSNDGVIIVVKVGSSTEQAPTQPTGCTVNCGCTTNCNPSEEHTGTGKITSSTCPDGITDTEAPTCTLNYIVPVENGVRANFECTDNTSAPEIASLFNGTANGNILRPYDFLLANGTKKSGTIEGNTKKVQATWTTINDTTNPPQAGVCYYYQYGAKDVCGNWTTYVTDYCVGF